MDYNDGASSDITKLLGEGRWQMKRLPSHEIAERFADAGIRLHFAGHMHINDTDVENFPSGMLVNIQVPSLASYKPGYKALTVLSPSHFLVQTKFINKVSRYNELFPFYEKEYDLLKKKGRKDIWNRDIIKSKSYGEFMYYWLKELVRLRMIPEEWPKKFIEKAETLSAEKILSISGDITPRNEVAADFIGWKFDDAVTDLYRLWFADSAGKRDIPQQRLSAYTILEENFEKLQPADEFSQELKLFFGIMKKFSTGAPAENFEIDFDKRTVVPVP